MELWGEGQLEFGQASWGAPSQPTAAAAAGPPPGSCAHLTAEGALKPEAPPGAAPSPAPGIGDSP